MYVAPLTGSYGIQRWTTAGASRTTVSNSGATSPAWYGVINDPSTSKASAP